MSNVILKMTPKRIYPILRHDVRNAPVDLYKRKASEYFGGVGFIAGRFPGTLTVDGQPAARVIECRTRDNRKLVATTWSNPVDGTYVFHNINADLEYDLIARDHNRVYSDVIVPAVKPWPYNVTVRGLPSMVESNIDVNLPITGGAPPYTIQVDDSGPFNVELQDNNLVIVGDLGEYDSFTISFKIEDSSNKVSSYSIIAIGDSAKFWRIYIHNSQHPTTALTEIEMYDSEVGYDNLCVGGVAFASSEYSTSWSADKAFDGIKTGDQGWSAISSSEPPHWIAYEFSNHVRIDSLQITSRNSTTQYAPEFFSVQKSINGIDWVNVTDFYDDDTWAPNEWRNYYFGFETVEIPLQSVTQSSVFGSGGAWEATIEKLYDDNATTGGGNLSVTGGVPQWIEFDLGDPVYILEVGLTAFQSFSSNSLTNSSLEVLDENDNWVKIQDIPTLPSQIKMFYFRVDLVGSKVRLITTQSGHNLGISEFRAIGKK